MILSTPFYIVIAVLSVILTIFIYFKITDPGSRSIRSLLTGIILVPVMAIYICMGLSKKIMVVEDSNQVSSGLQNTTYEVFGHPSIPMSDGSKASTRGLGIRMFSKTIFNASSKNLLVYPVVYGNTHGLSSSFKRAENKKTPDPVYIPSGCFDKVKKTPDFWFKTPPSTISEDEDFLVSIWHGIIGSAKVKWCVIEYNYEPEVE